ncbi:MAG TPA: biopolymer transporter ExbD [Planctomycetaceae bacterium]|nr:biopolymer transporter ExbD [Planctomycetaceae bacterium]
MVRAKKSQKLELNMTPMIDIVFMLLSFFIMTFKIVAPEGDFSVKMPFGGAPPTDKIDADEPVRIKLIANSSGDLTNIMVGDTSIGDNFNQLRARIHKMANVGEAPTKASDMIVELQPDDKLRYEYTIDAITAISGFTQGGRTYPLVENIRFNARPKAR